MTWVHGLLLAGVFVLGFLYLYFTLPALEPLEVDEPFLEEERREAARLRVDRVI